MTISSNDIIFVRAYTDTGAELTNLRLTGMTSVADVLAALREALRGQVGRLRAVLRNYTQGGSHSIGLQLQPRLALRTIR